MYIKNMIIAIDFDGTCVTHEYPNVGKDINAIPVLKNIVNKGHKIILYTMRHGKELQDAVEWFVNNNIPLYGINENPTQKNWTKSPKIYAHIYIDDAALGCPLIFNEEYSDRPYVDWEAVQKLLEEKIIL
jgi:hypothetical protein